MWSTLWNSFVKSVIVAGLFLSIGNIEVRASNLSFRSENIGEILKIIGLPQSQTTLTGKFGFCVLPREDAVNFLTQKTDYIESPDIYGNRRADVCYLVRSRASSPGERRTSASGQIVPLLTIGEFYRHLLTAYDEEFIGRTWIRALRIPTRFPTKDINNEDKFVPVSLARIIQSFAKDKYEVTLHDERTGVESKLVGLKLTDNFETIMSRKSVKDLCASEDGSISCTLKMPPSNGLCTKQMIDQQFLGCFDVKSGTQKHPEQDSSMTGTQKQPEQDSSKTGFGTWLMVILGFAAIVGAIWFAYNFYK
eukprot:64270_1